MASIRCRRVMLIAVLALGFASSRSPATAAPVPLRADIRAGHQIDIAAFERFVALRYDIHVRKAIAADIDRDGDLDLVAATDRGFIVWVNDGAGHLTSAPPTHAPAVDAHASDAVWRGHAAHVEETIQNTLPSVPLPGLYAHAPPALVAAKRSFSDPLGAPNAPLGYRTPRAPPA